MKIQFSPPDITDLEIEEVINTLKSGWITTGPKTKLFEKKLSDYFGTPRTVCLNSATAALEMTLRVLGVGEGDEVITSAYTYTASASVIHHVGAKIVLVDTAKDSFQMDYEKLSEAITDKTKVIIPVDLAGIMCDYDKIFEIVKKKSNIFCPSNIIQETIGRVVVLADAAHSLGAIYKGKMSGQVADFTCFSFHAVKNLTSGEGGAVTWRQDLKLDNDQIYKEYMLLSLHGQSKDALEKTKLGSWEYDIIYPAYKCNMTDVMASLGLVQLERYPTILNRRRQIISLYNEAFEENGFDILKHFCSDFSSSGHLYIIRLKNKDEEYRNRIIRKMADKGIATNVHYKPLPMHTAYKRLGFNINNYPNSFNMYKNEITLPLHTLLSDEQVNYISNNLINLTKNYVEASQS